MRLFLIFAAVTLCLFFYNFTQQPGEKKIQIFKEKDGILSIEAEHFYKQTKNDKRSWYVVDESFKSDLIDADENHASRASGKKYVECLPDTRTNHDEKLIQGENFTNNAGDMAILHYKINIDNPGKYYVWGRVYSTGTEDNGIHVGLNGSWPESGQRLQWCEGKNAWTWESKQRTEEVHCGEPELIYLEIEMPGEHEIQFSMREDGFEFDKFVLTKAYEKPIGEGPKEIERK